MKYSLILLAFILGVWTGYNGKTNITQNLYRQGNENRIEAIDSLNLVTNGTEPGTRESIYTVMRVTEDGVNYLYDVQLEDGTGYDFLTRSEVDTILSGRELSGKLNVNETIIK